MELVPSKPRVEQRRRLFTRYVFLFLGFGSRRPGGWYVLLASRQAGGRAGGRAGQGQGRTGDMGKPSSGKEATDGRGLVWFCCLAWTPSRVCFMAAFFSGCNCSDCIGSYGGQGGGGGRNQAS